MNFSLDNSRRYDHHDDAGSMEDDDGDDGTEVVAASDGTASEVVRTEHAENRSLADACTLW